MDKINPSQAMEELTLMLLYLSKFSETDRFSEKKDYYAWKGYAFKILNELEEKDYIRQGPGGNHGCQHRQPFQVFPRCMVRQ